MRPSARLQSAIELLDEIIAAARYNGASADNLAKKFFAARRYAGSKDRRAIRDLVWMAIRRFGECPASARSAFASIADSDTELQALFDGSDYGPAILSPDEARAFGGVLPSWILPYFASYIDASEHEALLGRAPLDIRVNTLKMERPQLLEILPEALELREIDTGLRLPTGFAIDQHDAITKGYAEVQDLGSQIIVQACNAKPGMKILDLCAGAGGKTLGLAACMNANGYLLSCDTNRARLDHLMPRAIRAGAHNIEKMLLNPGQEIALLSEHLASFDVVLIDAPYSGGAGEYIGHRRAIGEAWRAYDLRSLFIIG
jgi:16S rRNA (cytosine967-C5)-methyltransferase